MNRREIVCPPLHLSRTSSDQVRNTHFSEKGKMRLGSLATALLKSEFTLHVTVQMQWSRIQN